MVEGKKKSQTKKTVSVVKCADYDREKICEAVDRAIDLIGGPGRFVSPGQKVLVKFNLLTGSAPEKAVTTHPAVVYAVAKRLKEFGCDVLLGDSPGSGIPYTVANLRKHYAASGFDKVAEELGVPLNYDLGFRNVPAPESKAVKEFSIINPALDCDAIVSVSKAKTHMLTFLSGGVKNSFGLIPGLEKPPYHARLSDPADFGRMLVDLNEVVKPTLQIMDAVVGMEGEGPHTGTPRPIGAILASASADAIDTVACRLISLDPLRVPTIRAAVERGLLKEDLSDVALAGDKIEGLIVKDYLAPGTYRDQLKPVIDAEKCIGCLKCARSCPVKTIKAVKKKARINYSKCIRCYCCHEMCDTGAISLERSE